MEINSYKQRVEGLFLGAGEGKCWSKGTKFHLCRKNRFGRPNGKQDGCIK